MVLNERNTSSWLRRIMALAWFAQYVHPSMRYTDIKVCHQINRPRVLSFQTLNSNQQCSIFITRGGCYL
ncbi:hypothetical protein DFA_09380 [Cavenderia fasciculata]|uniref:Uncharacterized protein n=1 Tax=Cavenderia fasciculata TaxID=261658 RepID=F4Q7G7_CACFS|nr:uncharacterized protein DFA_09380 [Cavenderia fasciculata]EGG16349.1 hypothetical protein DFA_09380 [Cavenderia fasciculata]|eukprot:XP_004354733.1 hypothetical protein DFA_09380 [Cavenderia fasciculata]